jgi:Cd2+-exporting ATPase
VSEICLSGLALTARAITLALTKESKHPISAAIAMYLSERGVGQFVFSETTSIVSKGLESTLPDTNSRVRGGDITWIDAEDNQEVQRLFSQSLTVFRVRLGSTLIAAYGLQDNLRPDARQVISHLQDRGIQISIVSGDEDNAVRVVAH